MTVFATQSLALFLLTCALAMAAGALMSRSIFVACAQVAAAGATAAAVVLLLGAGDGALALALFAAGWAPVLLLAGMLLSARTAARQPDKPWLSAIAAAIAAGAVLWTARDASSADPAAASVSIGPVAFWLAPLVFAAAIACVAMLGFGERGVLDGAAAERAP